MIVFKIIFANIRKRKGAVITFLVMVMLATLMLSISLSLIIGSTNFYAKKVEELGAPHYRNDIIASSYKDEFTEFTKNYKGTSDVSVLNSIIGVGSKIKTRLDTSTATMIIHSAAETNQSSFYKLQIIDALAYKPTEMIILNYTFKTGGLRSGEKITLSISDKNYDFTIYGFCEDAIFGASTYGTSIAYIGDENFNSLSSDENFMVTKTLMARFSDSGMTASFISDFQKFSKLKDDETLILGDYNSCESNATMFIKLMSIILLIFSLIVLIIAFVVASFSISSSISEDIATIGALKSIGYKNKSLKASQILQYLMVAISGSIIGALISLATFGFLGNIITSTSGLLWIAGANILPLLLAIVIVCALTLFVASFATRRYKKITPINALRQGDSHHSSKRNFFPLSKYNIPLNMQLGFKRFFGGFKSNIVLLVVVAMLVFISSMVNSLSYNLNNDRTAMINMVGLEMAQLWVITSGDADISEINTEIKDRAEVSHTMLMGSESCTVEGYETTIQTEEDFSKLIINPLIKGEFPKENNEITLGAITSKITGKTVGDRVRVETDGKTKEYIVCGITQSMDSDAARITEQAMRIQSPNFKMHTIYVYLDQSADPAECATAFKNFYGNKIVILNTKEQIDTILNSIGSPLAAITAVMIVVTVIVIGFVLFLMISTLVRKQKKEFGIMKAIGFKTGRLILQLMISYLPSLIIGTLLGIALGFTIINPLLSVFFSGMGMPKTYFLIPALPAILIGLGIFGSSILTIYLVALRLKKISPQKLIVEQ